MPLLKRRMNTREVASTNKSGITSAITLNTNLAGVVPLWQNSRRLISIFICEHKNIKMSNPWQPFTDARRRRVAKVVDQQADSFDMTSLAASCAQA
jgi:hypothetical protein